MSGLCLATAALVAFLPVRAFTLAWTHSIEKVRWEEDWRIEASALVIEQARIRASGAGMEPPEGAVLKDGVWSYRPRLAAIERLRLAHSEFVAGYELCAAGRCRSLAELAAPADNAVVELYACDGRPEDGH
ncbi:MAG: DUF1850 domain-containing protein [Rhodocyclaceae bacterium]